MEPEVTDQPRGDVAQRALWWALFVSELLATKAELRDHVPSGAKLVILPAEDPELCAHNLRLAEGQRGLQVYLKLERTNRQISITPQLPAKTYHYVVA
jgi:hypothetical protein